MRSIPETGRIGLRATPPGRLFPAQPAPETGIHGSKRPWQLLSCALVLFVAADKGTGWVTLSRSGARDPSTGRGGLASELTRGLGHSGSQAARREAAAGQEPSSARLAPAGPLVPAASSEEPQAEAESSPRVLGGSGGGGESHPHEALFFLLSALVFGTVILHLTTLPQLRGLQQTVVLFVLGVIYSLVLEGLDLTGKTGIMGRSYLMWMGIDPHLILFVMLPVLLTGDAMTIDTSIARCVWKQCIFLAGPGVCISSFVTAAFLYVYLPYEWPFLLCVVTGSILAATDPVAVVGLLKELGASPTLTVQIQGESLLNDGTAIVLYTVAYKMLAGEDHGPGEIVIFLVKTALCAAALGVVIGWLFVLWIRTASNRLDHHSGMIQSALTLCCAYGSFVISEGVLHISGVLCTVASSLVLADKMWPAIVDKESLHHVWHMFEYLGNTIIFFLAGALTGQIMVHIKAADYGHLLVIYVVSTLIRGCLFFSSRPILTYLSEDRIEKVSFADAAIMTWGGLRGAVGLVLAMQVSIEQAGGKIEKEEGQRVLFYVGGIAMLTLCVNATTCPALVKVLGITSTPAAKQRLLFLIHERLQRRTKDAKHQGPTAETIQEVLHAAKHHIDSLVTPELQKTSFTKGMDKLSAKFTKVVSQRPYQEIVGKFDRVKADYKAKDVAKMALLLEMPPLPDVEDEERTREAITSVPDGQMVQVINEAFLSLVRSHYWKQIDSGCFVAGTTDAELLLSSVSIAYKYANKRLHDFSVLKHSLSLVHKEEVTDRNQITQEVIQEDKEDEEFYSATHRTAGRETTRLSAGLAAPGRFTACLKLRLGIEKDPEPTRQQRWIDESVPFNLSLAVIICANAIFIAVEQSHRNEGNYHHPSWFIIEVIFNAIFLMEFIIKLIFWSWRYFLRPWNIFDFVLLVLGLTGVVLEFLGYGRRLGSSDADVSGESRLFRFNRVFRVLRIVRIFRLAKFYRVLRAKFAKKDLCLELAEHLQSITVLRAFVRAHVESQRELQTFCGNGGDLCACEFARCLMESRTEILQAQILAANEAKTVSKEILSHMTVLRSNISATSELSDFIMGATKGGVISSREAECVLHLLDDKMRNFYKKLQQSQEGWEEKEGERASLESLTSVVPLSAGAGSACEGSKQSEEDSVGREAAKAQDEPDGRTDGTDTTTDSPAQNLSTDGDEFLLPGTART